jgi:membrane associated rhomboid family serine protease
MDTILGTRNAVSRPDGPAARLTPVAVLVVGMWLVRILDVVLPTDLVNGGILPRQGSGLDGVVWAPLLHVSFGHLLANTVPLCVLGGLIALGNRARFLAVSAITWLGSGLGVWLIAPTRTVTVGASGVVFGLLGYLVARGVFDRKPMSILLGLGALGFYGGMLFGVLPNRAGVSWQAHLFGLVSGIGAAALLDRRSTPNRPEL